MLLLLIALSNHANAAPLSNEADEGRAQHLFTQVRCMVCHGESIADSGAAFAEETRDLIRHRIQAGVSDESIMAELKQRFGEQIVMDPGWNASTYLLWALPLLVLLFGLYRLRSNLLQFS